MLEQEAAVFIWRRVLSAVLASEAHLDALDAVGDGDLGRSLAAGCRVALERLEAQGVRTLAQALEVTATALGDVAASSMGTLVARGLEGAAGALPAEAPLERADAVAAVQAFAATVTRLGRAAVGDKTMVDVVVPLAELLSGLPPDLSRPALRDRIADAVHSAVERTVPLRARKGRARWLGEASVGQPDAGSVAVKIAVDAALMALSATTDEPQARDDPAGRT